MSILDEHIFFQGFCIVCWVPFFWPDTDQVLLTQELTSPFLIRRDSDR